LFCRNGKGGKPELYPGRTAGLYWRGYADAKGALSVWRECFSAADCKGFARTESAPSAGFVGHSRYAFYIKESFGLKGNP
ncbi:MAG: hypothetical protein J6J65_00505, partial [Opitutales bacterium]|nr:hypothetical protein [Opitutales bacterium]